MSGPYVPSTIYLNLGCMSETHYTLTLAGSLSNLPRVKLIFSAITLQPVDSSSYVFACTILVFEARLLKIKGSYTSLITCLGCLSRLYSRESLFSSPYVGMPHSIRRVRCVDHPRHSLAKNPMRPSHGFVHNRLWPSWLVIITVVFLVELNYPRTKAGYGAQEFARIR